jgi:hypothetical protein
MQETVSDFKARIALLMRQRECGQHIQRYRRSACACMPAPQAR